MIRWEVPLKTVSESNDSSHWVKKAKRHKSQQFVIKALFYTEKPQIKLPCRVTMTRLSPKELDDDNLRGCLKWIRDEISEQILPEYRKYYLNARGKLQKIAGRADADPRIEWAYSQEKAGKMGIRIEIVPKEPA